MCCFQPVDAKVRKVIINSVQQLKPLTVFIFHVIVYKCCYGDGLLCCELRFFYKQYVIIVALCHYFYFCHYLSLLSHFVSYHCYYYYYYYYCYHSLSLLSLFAIIVTLCHYCHSLSLMSLFVINVTLCHYFLLFAVTYLSFYDFNAQRYCAYLVRFFHAGVSMAN